MSEQSREPRCSSIAAECEEPLLATASQVRRWLLVESPGAWGPDALTQSGLDPALFGRLARRAKAAGVRVLLIRSPAREEPAERSCFAAMSGPSRPWMRRARFADVAAVDLDAVFRAGGDGFGEPWRAPLHLVCTHGRHDPCCADLGRPLVRALRGEVEGLWECSHVGGDRFAGNLLCLPHGLYFGQVGPEVGVDVARGYERGSIALEHYRGRSCYDLATQAADHFLRGERDLRGVDAVVVLGREEVEEGVHLVHLRHDGGPAVDVWLATSHVEEARLTSCKNRALSRPPTYRLLDVRDVGP